VRGFIEAHGRYKLSNTWATGLDAERTTDDTFLQRYRFGWRDVLTSKLYAERIENRNYASVEAISFQGLTTQDDSSVSPTILPKAKVHFESEPQFAHSRTSFDGNLLVSERNEGVSTRRVSGTVGWKVPYITKGGQVFEAGATLRGDVYDIQDQVIDTSNQNIYSGTLGRVMPQFTLDWRYPLVKPLGDNRSLMISPIAQIAISPRMHQTNKFPNEDSQVAELNETNLFSANRYTGLDQIESGARFTYGARGHLQNADDEWLEWLFGQSYQENDDSSFPITNDDSPHFSDFIGRVGMKYKWLDIAYSFRLDRDRFIPISNSVNTLFNLNPVSFDISYTSLRDDPIFGNRKEIFGAGIWDVTDNWQWSINARRDLGSNEQALVRSAFLPQNANPLEISPGTVGLGSSLTYHNECLKVTASVGRSFISQQDVRPSTTFGLVIILNNFGDGDEASHKSPTGAGNLNTVETNENSDMSVPRTTNLETGSAP
jgi:LPS-assembly protein